MAGVLPDSAVRGAYRKVVAAAAAGTFMEIYDLLVYGYFASVLAQQFFPHQDPTAGLLATFALFAVGFLVRPVGAVLFGHLGDRVGRRPALVASLLLMSASTLTFGLLPTYRQVGLLAPALLLLCRVLQGLSGSGEQPGANVLVWEYAPDGRQGRSVALVNAAGNLGAATAAAIGFVLARVLGPDQLAAWGWRVPFLVAALIGVIGLYLRVRVLDSPAFVALGEASGRAGLPLLRALRTGRLGLLVLAVWTAASSLGGYMLVGFLPTYVIRHGGVSAAEAFAANGLAVLVLAGSTLVGGYLVDRSPLPRVAVGVLLGVMLTAVPAFLLVARSGTFVGVLVGQSMWAAFLGAAGLLGAVLGPVFFPVAIRFTATALASNLAITLFGSTAPYVSTWLVAASGSLLAPAVYLLVVCGAALVTVLLGVRATRLRPDRATGATGV